MTDTDDRTRGWQAGVMATDKRDMRAATEREARAIIAEAGITISEGYGEGWVDDPDSGIWMVDISHEHVAILDDDGYIEIEARDGARIEIEVP